MFADVNRPSSPGVFCNYIVMQFYIAPQGCEMLQRRHVQNKARNDCLGLNPVVVMRLGVVRSVDYALML